MSYKKNFLDKVIVRCDFLDSFDIRQNCPEELMKEFRSMGPVESKKKRIGGQIKITPEGVNTNGAIEENMLWIFTDKESGKNFTISHDHFSIEYDRYEDFNILTGDFEKVVEVIKSNLNVFTCKRLGLRFIDVFEIGDGDPLKWDKYINPAYLVTTNDDPPESDRQYLSRAFNRKEYKYPERRIILQYGIHNPSYPSPVCLRQYILDTDVSSVEVLEIEELKSKLDDFYKKAMAIFESAITKDLREIMQNG